jgi:hypothetical protein
MRLPLLFTGALIIGACTDPPELATDEAADTGDPGYRAQLYPSNSGTLQAPLTSWQLKYVYTVPPIPSVDWNPSAGEGVYVWGDVTFDNYGGGSGTNQHPVGDAANYLYNQIVPQIGVGDVTDGSTTTGSGSNQIDVSNGEIVPLWQAQAQYFWRSVGGVNHALVGPKYTVYPGDLCTSYIDFNVSDGSMTAAIACTNATGTTTRGSSTLDLPRPFPDDTNKTAYTNWTKFFAAAASASHTAGPLIQPQMNVETHVIDNASACSMLPWKVSSESATNVTLGGVMIDPVDGLACNGDAHALITYSSSDRSLVIPSSFPTDNVASMSTVPSADFGGSTTLYNPPNGSHLSYLVDVPTSGAYEVWVSYKSTQAVQANVKWGAGSGTPAKTSPTVTLPAVTTWYEPVIAGNLYMTQGINRIDLDFLSGLTGQGFEVAYLKID